MPLQEESTENQLLWQHVDSVLQHKEQEMKNYKVIKFTELPYWDINQYVIVPESWIKKKSTTDNKVSVAFPEEDIGKTKERVKNNEVPERDWRLFEAVVIYEADDFDDADFWRASQDDDALSEIARLVIEEDDDTPDYTTESNIPTEDNQEPIENEGLNTHARDNQMEQESTQTTESTSNVNRPQMKVPPLRINENQMNLPLKVFDFKKEFYKKLLGKTARSVPNQTSPNSSKSSPNTSEESYQLPECLRQQRISVITEEHLYPNNSSAMEALHILMNQQHGQLNSSMMKANENFLHQGSYRQQNINKKPNYANHIAQRSSPKYTRKQTPSALQESTNHFPQLNNQSLVNPHPAGQNYFLQQVPVSNNAIDAGSLGQGGMQNIQLVQQNVSTISSQPCQLSEQSHEKQYPTTFHNINVQRDWDLQKTIIKSSTKIECINHMSAAMANSPANFNEINQSSNSQLSNNLHENQLPSQMIIRNTVGENHMNLQLNLKKNTMRPPYPVQRLLNKEKQKIPLYRPSKRTNALIASRNQRVLAGPTSAPGSNTQRTQFQGVSYTPSTVQWVPGPSPQGSHSVPVNALLVQDPYTGAILFSKPTSEIFEDASVNAPSAANIFPTTANPPGQFFEHPNNQQFTQIRGNNPNQVLHSEDAYLKSPLNMYSVNTRSWPQGIPVNNLLTQRTQEIPNRTYIDHNSIEQSVLFESNTKRQPVIQNPKTAAMESLISRPVYIDSSRQEVSADADNMHIEKLNTSICDKPIRVAEHSVGSRSTIIQHSPSAGNKSAATGNKSPTLGDKLPTPDITSPATGNESPPPCKQLQNSLTAGNISTTEEPLSREKAELKLINEMSVFFKSMHLEIIKTQEAYKETRDTYEEYLDAFKKAMNMIGDFCESAIPDSNEVTATTLQKKTGINRDDNEEIYEVPKKKPNIELSFVLPPEYDPHDTRWTLKHQSISRGLVELMPHSRIFVATAKLGLCKKKSKDYNTLARMLLSEIFSRSALGVCSLTGEKAKAFRPKDSEVRPGLDKNGIQVLLTFVEDYGRKKGWRQDETRDQRSIENTLRSSIRDYRKKYENEMKNINKH